MQCSHRVNQKPILDKTSNKLGNLRIDKPAAKTPLVKILFSSLIFGVFMLTFKRAILLSSYLFSATVFSQEDSSEFNSYQTECLTEQEVQTKRSLELSAEEFILGQTVYLDESCEQPVYSFDYTGTYSRDLEALSVDWFLEKVLITPESDVVANAFIQTGLCGLTEWKLGVAVDVTGLECQGSVILEKPSYYYDLIKETPEGIFLGKPSEELNGNSPETRPVEFEEVLYSPVEVVE